MHKFHWRRQNNFSQLDVSNDHLTQVNASDEVNKYALRIYQRITELYSNKYVNNRPPFHGEANPLAQSTLLKQNLEATKLQSLHLLK